MANHFKISSKYWNTLSEKEKMFFRYNAANAGVQQCKRIITLSNIAFPEWEDIVDFNRYDKGSIIGCHWLVLTDNKPIGIIHKTEGYGVTESIDVKTHIGYEQAWTNYLQKNPPKDVKVKKFHTELYSYNDSCWDNGLDFFGLTQAVNYAKEKIKDGWDKVKIYYNKTERFCLDSHSFNEDANSLIYQ